MEDPPGFERICDSERRPYYNLLPVLGKNIRKKFYNQSQVETFLKEQQAMGNFLNISAKSFDFRKRKAVRSEEVKIKHPNREKIANNEENTSLNATCTQDKSIFNSDNLLDGDLKLDHESELRQVASKLDSFRRDVKSVTNEEACLAEVQTILEEQKTFCDIVEVLSNYQEASIQMSKVVEERSLLEMLCLPACEGSSPLSDFPNNMKENWYCEVTKFAMKHSPVTTSFLANLIMKERGNNVEPLHVIDFATVFAHLAKCVTKTNNAGDKMMTLQLKMGGLTDNGIDAIAKQNLCVTADTLRNYRDHFAEVANDILIAESANMPMQYGIDNCDTKREHITVEYVETETFDTSHMCNESSSPNEIGEFFKPELLMLGGNEHETEKTHLEFVIAVAVGREIGKLRPQKAEQLLKYLPEHPRHPQSDTPLTQAKIRLVTPHYYMETNNSEMISLAEDIQREKLDMLKQKRPNDVQLHKDLIHIYLPLSGEENSEEKEAREVAEYRVQKAVEKSGESIGHGDLLTVNMFQRAVLLRSGSVRAVDRLAYLGPFRLQLFHLCMNKTALDILAGMPNERNRVDEGSLGQMAGILGVTSWFTNKKKKIVRSGNYEKHVQTLRAFQCGLLGNLFDNYIEANPTAMASISNKNSAVDFVTNMLLQYGIQYYWDPTFVDPTAHVKCDLFRSSKDQIIRLVVDLAFRICEKENDATGLRALRRLMVLYFLNKSTQQNSNYAKFILTDLVVEASASDRSKERMDRYVTVNPSGTRGGGLFRDKYNEILIQFVKEAIKKQHSSLNHIQIETLVQSICLMTKLNDHNQKSCLSIHSARSATNDLIGDARRELIAEIITEQNPFNLNRSYIDDWVCKTRGTPFENITIANVERFVDRVKEQFMLQFPRLV